MPIPTMPEIIQTLDKADTQIAKALSKERETPIEHQESEKAKKR